MLGEEYECTSCNALFSVEHDMDDTYYRVLHCPFCGEGIDQEEYDFDSDQESE
jgi:DNA-directed RNA polymerase subunit RPC12/RpoP